MRIVVCIKRVPDTESRIRIDEHGQAIERGGLKHIISPYDEYALETALKWKDADAGTEVVVVTLGEPAAAEQLRSALAMGADRAVLLRGEPTLDGLTTAHALAAEIGGLEADLVLLGMKSVDADQQQVPAMLAEQLSLPCITVAAELTREDGAVACHCEVEGGVDVLRAPLPAVVSITKGKFEPRYPSLKGIMAAKKKPLEEKEAQQPPARVRVRGLVPPPERPAGRIVGQGADAVPELVRLLREEAKAL